MGITSVIFGCSGLSLTSEERAFYTKVQPWGFILFGRNIDTPEQVSKLVADLKSCVDHDIVPVLIDQEGGRVRRLRPPHWDAYAAGCVFGEHYAIDSTQGKRIAWLQSRLMACDLTRLGINIDCLPVLDIPVAGSHDVIGDRAYSNNPAIVSDIGRAASEGLMAGGVLPVVKHIPGHGRAGVDSHKQLPVVDTDLATLEKYDFAPFKDLAQMPIAMTAHVVYKAIDADEPATSSKIVVDQIIREFIGFDGLLICDDLSMNALSGDLTQRTQKAFAAGCDIVLHCGGNMAEMNEVVNACIALEGKALERAKVAMDLIGQIVPCDEAALREEYQALCETATEAADPTEAGY